MHRPPGFSDHVQRQPSWDSVADPEEYVTWHECAETEEELLLRRLSNSSASGRRTPHAAEWSTDEKGVRSLTVCPEKPHGTSPKAALEEHHLSAPSALEQRVAQLTRQEWETRSKSGSLDEELAEKLKDGFPELEEWTDTDTVRRMLRAMDNDEAEAIQLLVGAIECRVRKRDMLRSMTCEVTCDVRVIGRDIGQRPTLYLCARNQHGTLKDMIPQVFLALEAATQICALADGQVVFIVDMYGLEMGRNMDLAALKELSRTFGTVFADRMNNILIVDFSFFAQAFWSLVKPFLSERTKSKINFVDEAEARKIAKERLAPPTCTRLFSSFTINRDTSSSKEERSLHAQRTAICDVPLGSLRMPDAAG